MSAPSDVTTWSAFKIEARVIDPLGQIIASAEVMLTDVPHPGGPLLDKGLVLIREQLIEELSQAATPVISMPICRPAFTVPAGWLLCDHRTYITEAQYPILFRVLGEPVRRLAPWWVAPEKVNLPCSPTSRSIPVASTSSRRNTRMRVGYLRGFRLVP